jgi:hypothetical protein
MKALMKSFSFAALVMAMVLFFAFPTIFESGLSAIEIREGMRPQLPLQCSQLFSLVQPKEGTMVEAESEFIVTGPEVSFLVLVAKIEDNAINITKSLWAEPIAGQPFRLKRCDQNVKPWGKYVILVLGEGFKILGGPWLIFIDTFDRPPEIHTWFLLPSDTVSVESFKLGFEVEDADGDTLHGYLSIASSRGAVRSAGAEVADFYFNVVGRYADIVSFDLKDFGVNLPSGQYYWWAVSVTDGYSWAHSDIFQFYLAESSINSASRVPAQADGQINIALIQNYPNPFNPMTMVEYNLPKAGKVVLTVHNSIGQVIVTLFNGWQDTGSHRVTWDASQNSAGIYFLELKAGEFRKVIKMSLIK